MSVSIKRCLAILLVVLAGCVAKAEPLPIPKLQVWDNGRVKFLLADGPCVVEKVLRFIKLEYRHTFRQGVALQVKGPKSQSVCWAYDEDREVWIVSDNGGVVQLPAEGFNPKNGEVVKQ